jgi:hypothetical protein
VYAGVPNFLYLYLASLSIFLISAVTSGSVMTLFARQLIRFNIKGIREPRLKHLVLLAMPISILSVIRPISLGLIAVLLATVVASAFAFVPTDFRNKEPCKTAAIAFFAAVSWLLCSLGVAGAIMWAIGFFVASS